jgi:hypothetical protein
MQGNRPSIFASNKLKNAPYFGTVRAESRNTNMKIDSIEEPKDDVISSQRREFQNDWN